MDQRTSSGGYGGAAEATLTGGWRVADHEQRRAARRAAQRHSRLVRLFRLLVPGIGVAILIVVVAMIGISNYLSSLGLGNVSLTSDGLVMDSPELSGHDGDRSYRVSAERAIQRISDPRIIDLETIVAQLTLGPEQEVAVTAASGTYNHQNETLVLGGGIDVTTSEGYRARFGALSIDLKNGSVRTDDPVTVDSEHGSIRASRLNFDQDSGTLSFTGGISMTLLPPAKEKGQ